MVISRFDVVLVSLDLTMDSDVRKTHAYTVISPDEMNRQLNALIVAPMTSTSKSYPSRVQCSRADVQAGL